MMTPEEKTQLKIKYERIAQNTKRHHWVPQFYFKYFAASKGGKQFYMYQAGSDPLLVGVADVAVSEEFYTFEENDGNTKTRIFEGIFSEHEDLVANVLNNVIETGRLPDTKEARSHIAAFVSMLRVRGPSFMDWLKNMDIEHIKLFNQTLAEHPDSLREKLEESGTVFSSEEEFEEMRNFMLDPENYEIKMEKGEAYYFKQAMELSKELYTVLMVEKSWHLLVAPDKRHFITSDNPVFIQEPHGCPPDIAGGFLNGTVLLTISPKLCLAFRRIPLKNQKILLNREDVDNINRSIASSARRQLYSHTNSKDLMALCGQLLVGNESRVKITRLASFAPYYMSRGIPQYKESRSLQSNSIASG